MDVVYMLIRSDARNFMKLMEELDEIDRHSKTGG